MYGIRRSAEEAGHHEGKIRRDRILVDRQNAVGSRVLLLEHCRNFEIEILRRGVKCMNQFGKSG